MTIICKGRNGRFTYASHYTDVSIYPGQTPGIAYVEIFSNSPHTQAAPIQFDAPAPELIRFLRQLARELETKHRAAKKERGS